ncbi:hypothetical protein GLOTRDRAFT_112297 [Gloeophyllum trabeum ATCC 11539]|uniref:Uncharacterized protein n=1 Tax=Gloeophyllum trabeum (strain ATCC 11539 / FP-39264 / Madison 617) TaxID=670483 RepID=S7PW47_GLOTA|nr:uncharacterized protein GLOTRDRAFT_112297 [Gloeophyllum trabeum ATCC 11539]EPQ51743.1 hypothetical protein GLOTRDRAFT_112297 [Gloeophyllum trabeum ATCC 11539]
MGDLLSLSVVMISVLSFLTSLLAVLIRVQAHHFSLPSTSYAHADDSMASSSSSMTQMDKLWHWSASLGLPFNLNGASPPGMGADAGMGMGMGGYAGAAHLARMNLNMNWQITRKFGPEKPPPPPPCHPQPPLSMAKLIMSRHQRRPNRPPRRYPGMAAPSQARHSRLVESV